jgi:glycosyltransferase involved in cell wall biosynthesis
VRLLFLTPQPPYPPDQGAKLRNVSLMRIAADAGHDVELLTFAPSGRLCQATRDALAQFCQDVEAVPPPAARATAQRALDTVRSSYPDLMLRLWSPAFDDALSRRLRERRFDLVQAEGFELGAYLRLAGETPSVLDQHNLEYELQRSAWLAERRRPRRAVGALYSFLQWRKLLRWERRLVRMAAAVLAVSETEAVALERLSGRPVDVMPNGIDLESRTFREPAEQAAPELLFDGTMSFRPNDDAARWLCAQILPRIRARCPEARCWVVGRDPSPPLVRFNFGEFGAVVTGEVSTVEPYWERASVYLLPMRMGAGVRFKALEAMARGVPIDATELGMQGTGAQPERDYLRAERPEEFAEAVSRLLADTGLRRRLARQARETLAPLDWRRLAPRLLDVYDRARQASSGQAASWGRSG